MIAVSYEYNYADEFDLSGFQVMDEEDWMDMVEFYTNQVEEFEIYFGTNEALRFKSGAHVIKNISTWRLTLAESRILEKYVGVIDDGGVFEHYEARGYEDE